MGWRGGREAQKGGDTRKHMLIHFVVQKKLTQHYKAIISNNKIKKKRKWHTAGAVLVCVCVCVHACAGLSNTRDVDFRLSAIIIKH